MANSITKQPWEVMAIAVDFSQNMTDAEAVILGNSLVVAYDSDGLDVSDIIIEANSMVVVEDTKLQATVKAGTSGQKYKVSFRAWISESKNLEEDIFVKVKEL